jgi:septal ring factor EnvC (AmiA/AmiB activator)
MISSIIFLKSLLLLGFVFEWPFFLTIATISLTTMATLIRIFGPKTSISDDRLRESPFLKSLQDDIKEKALKLQNLKEIVQNTNIEVEKLKIETQNTIKTAAELKRDNRDLVQRLDDLLKQFMEYMEG